MIRLAREQSTEHPNIEYTLADVLLCALPAERYDCLASIATLHHLPPEQVLPKMKEALKPGGLLIIHDLIAADGIIERAASALAYPVSVARRLWKTGRLRAPKELRDAWREHGRRDVYPTLSEVREMCSQYLTGARIHRHLLWRYTVVWRKPWPKG
jgi:2-polyprenyl-3-methyl-5-hydroxy-6-metoxy-1,4-benzoquinol methylase